MNIVIDNSQVELDSCLAKFNTKLVSESFHPADIDSSGLNAALDTVTTTDDGVQYIRYHVPHSIIESLQRLDDTINRLPNGLPGFAIALNLPLTQIARTVSDSRFEIPRYLNEIEKTFKIQFKNNEEMGSKFEEMNDYVLKKVHNPMDDLRPLITNLVKEANPVLGAAALAIGNAAFGNAEAELVYHQVAKRFQTAMDDAGVCFKYRYTYIWKAIYTAHSQAKQTYKKLQPDFQTVEVNSFATHNNYIAVQN